MTPDNTVDKEPQSEIEALLPWHAAGTLSRSDARRVEEALASDPELARRYALVRDEFGETIHLNETLGAPSAHAMDKLIAKNDAEKSLVTKLVSDIHGVSSVKNEMTVAATKTE